MKIADFAQHAARIMLGLFLTYTGLSHLFWARIAFQAQVPEFLPISPNLVVILSGIVELTLAISLIFVRRFRVQIGWAAAAFFVMVFPGNIAQYLHHKNAFMLDSDSARLIRLFFQPVLVLWALWSTGAWPRSSRTHP